MTRSAFGASPCLAALAFAAAFLAGCGDVDSFVPISRPDANQDSELSSSSRYSSSCSSSSYSSSSSSARSSSSSQSRQNLNPLLKERGEQFNPDIDYGTMTDPRDGKTYRTVVVNGQTWMAENLNYADNGIGLSLCYNDDEEMCELYGRLYSRDAAMNSSKCAGKAVCLLGNGPIQGLCPDGWHIPTYSEAQALVDLVDSNASLLMSAKGWGIDGSISGTDEYGLSFVGTGGHNAEDNFNSYGLYTFMWVYRESSYMYYLLIRGVQNEAYIYNFDKYETRNPVRCIKNK